MKNISSHQILGLLLLIFSVGFNLWIYRLEPTAFIDPNDNTFQYALVDRTNQMWDYADKKCSGITKPFCALSYLTDHWVPNWAEGYNLPYYYSHLPQIGIVASYRLTHGITQLSLFTHYHVVIYLLLSLFPLSVFWALRVVGHSWISAGMGALISTHLSTDGLYGLDPASFLWRGYGLSSQLFAMIWLPLAFAYGHRWISQAHKSTSTLLLAISTLTVTTASHLGIGMITFLSLGIMAISSPIQSFLAQTLHKNSLSEAKNTLLRLIPLFGGVGLLLGYWIMPILFHDNYHNISYWDPVWKFDSYGAKETIIRLLNGDLLDFGRLPILTILTLLGIIITINSSLFPFALLFVFWLLMYFGRTTWGGVIDLIPGMSEYHLSRFIVGLHITSLFLIPKAFEWIMQLIPARNARPFIMAAFIILLGFLVYPQTLRYSAHNDVLIKQANDNYTTSEKDANELILTLKELQKTSPGRVFAGRGGTWGKEFRIAETPYFMHLSTFGIPTVLWLPQTWSPNSDTEQYFSEDQPKDYVLYNIRYVAAPPTQETQPFWNLIKESPTWKLYEVQTEGYITTGIRPAIVSIQKETFVNVVRLWIQSEYHKQKLYPELTFDPTYPRTSGLPNFRMTDEATYKIPDGSEHSLFAEVPRYLPPTTEVNTPKVLSQSNESDMVFKTNVEVPEDCKECIVILHQSAHPSWKVTVDGKKAETMTVFPFYTAVKLETAGQHEVVFSYQSSTWKKLLFFIGMISIIIGLLIHLPNKATQR
jgi:hypothetical protein